MTGTLRLVFERSWLIAALLAIWQALSSCRILDPLFFPPPSSLIGTFLSMSASGQLLRQLGCTLARTGAGYIAGALGGIVVSILICSWAPLRKAAEPVISAVYASPRLTLLPMAMLIFGVNEFARVSLVALSTLLIVVIQIAAAVQAVGSSYVDLAKNYGASGATLIRRIYLPACMPQAFTALRLAFGRALVLTISIELLSSNNGIGNMIWAAWQTFAIERLYVSILTAAALGLVSQAGLGRIEQALTPWKKRRA